MSTEPSIAESITIDGNAYTFTEAPNAPGILYAEIGRKARVYRVTSAGHFFALKTFKARYRSAQTVENTGRIAAFQDVPGLSVAHRTILLPDKYPDLIKQHEDFAFAVLMPWVEGKSWFNLVTGRVALSRQDSLKLARALANALRELEQRDLAHCDLSSSNFIFSPDFEHVELIDIEDMFGHDLIMPAEKPAGTGGYAPDWVKKDGIWEAGADRFSTSILLSEILAWQFDDIRAESAGDAFFAEGEFGHKSKRFRMMSDRLEQIHPELSRLFKTAWYAESVEECPRIADWKNVLDKIREPELQVDPVFLKMGTLDLTQVPPLVPNTTITVKNVGGGNMSGQVRSNLPWLSVTPSDFSCPQGGESKHTITLLDSAPHGRRQKEYNIPDGVTVHTDQKDQVLNGSYSVSIPKKSFPVWATILIVVSAIAIISGTMIAAFSKGSASTEASPIQQPAELSEAPVISGTVLDSDGLPVSGVNLAIIQNDQRVDVDSGEDGNFSVEVPTDGTWNVQIVGIRVDSHVMNQDGNGLGGYFELLPMQDVVVPQTSPLSFVFEKATAYIKGYITNDRGEPIPDLSVSAHRADGASSWGTTDGSGYFELPASGGTWVVYTVTYDPAYEEGEWMGFEIEEGSDTDIFLLPAPPSIAEQAITNTYPVLGINNNGTSTELSVREGDVISFSSSGTWCWGGSDIECSDANGTAGRPGPEELPVTLDGQYFGTLIGRVGDWYFPIGEQAEVSMESDGTLYLLMNDRVDSYQDNSGKLLVTINKLSQQNPTHQTLSFQGETIDAEILLVECTQNWESCHNSTSSNTMWSDLMVGTVGASYEGDHYNIQRLFLFFDTSSLPENAIVTSAVLHLYVDQFMNGNTRFEVVESSAHTPPTMADFDAIGDVSGGGFNPTRSNTWIEIPLNGSAMHWISLSGTTRLGLRNDYDMRNTAPSERNDALISLSDNTQFAPYLDVTYSTSSRPILFQVDSRSDWQNTGVVISQEDVVMIQYISGSWTINNLNAADPYTDGNGNPAYYMDYYVYNAPSGALIGKIGENGTPFLVGNDYASTSGQNGELFLRINDGNCNECETPLGDNQGELIVQVSVH